MHGKSSTMRRMLQIFRTGKHAKALTPKVLAATAAAYDPNKHEAPLVVGHPVHDAPAHGWVASLSYDDTSQLLNAEPTQINPTFAEAVNAGRYKKISASFYTPGHPANPTPNDYYLRHVGFLGAQTPAVKGMRPVQFSDEDNNGEVLTVSFAEHGMITSNLGRILRRIRDFIIAEKGVEDGDRVLPDWEIKDIENAGNDGNEDFSEEETNMPDQTQDFAEREAALVKREAILKTEEEALTKKRLDASKQEAMDFAEQLVTEGRLLPKDKAPIAELIGQLPANATVSFAEGNDAPTPNNASAYLRGFLSALPQVVNYAEVSGSEGAHQAIQTTVPTGYQVDAKGLSKDQKIANYAEQHKITYLEAIQALNSKGALQTGGAI